ncbi:hypothetical protein [Sedimentitalea todarodis]|uniref:Uncharacterized protein n=1 Tax=Sedimentitalea todarodis TaxID=1631240 RepID=A0ABU3VLS7_9RHOB|nr:hypothetical protein [Sedimentitalea todarodis]MDU9007162.1 hypothetical protein [Sedimentitalea todarodis]
MARQFKFGEAAEKNTENGVIDIPHTCILQTYSARELVDKFEATWGRKPSAVALPVSNADGLLFDVDGLSKYSAAGSGFKDGIGDFGGLVKAFATEGLNIYLTLDVTLPFQESPPLQIVDIVGDSSRHLCFGNPTTVEILGAILGTGIDLAFEALQDMTPPTNSKLLGVVLDLVNLWPMGGSDNRLELTCFCPSCQEYFELHEKGKRLIDKFKTFPNPWSLALRATESGISFVDEIGINHGAKEIVGFSRLKGFDAAFGSNNGDSELIRKADDLLKYMSVRHDQVMSSVDSVFSEAMRGLSTDKNPYISEAARMMRRVILVEGTSYSWSGGIFIEKLDQLKPAEFDEIWADKGPQTPILKCVPNYAYMSRRSRYYLDAFFEVIANAADSNAMATTGMGRMVRDQLQELLVQRLQQSLACLTAGKAALGTLGVASDDEKQGRQGYVGIALDKTAGIDLINGVNIARGPTAKK